MNLNSPYFFYIYFLEVSKDVKKGYEVSNLIFYNLKDY